MEEFGMELWGPKSLLTCARNDHLVVQQLLHITQNQMADDNHHLILPWILGLGNLGRAQQGGSHWQGSRLVEVRSTGWTSRRPAADAGACAGAQWGMDLSTQGGLPLRPSGVGVVDLLPQSKRPREPEGGCLALEPQKSHGSISTGRYWGSRHELPKFKGRGHGPPLSVGGVSKLV